MIPCFMFCTELESLSMANRRCIELLPDIMKNIGKRSNAVKRRDFCDKVAPVSVAFLT